MPIQKFNFNKGAVEFQSYLRRSVTYFLFVFVLGFGYAETNAQNAKIDSLKQQLVYANKDKNQVNLLYELGAVFWDYDFESGFYYSNKCLSLAQDLNDSKGITQAYTNLGLYYYFKGDYSKAKEQYTSGLKALNGEIYADFPAYTLTCLGNLYREQSKFDSALIYYQYSFDNLLENSSKLTLSSIFYNKGLTMLELEVYDSVFVNLNEALRLREEMNDSLLIAEIWKELGLAYMELEKYDSAQVYFDKLEKIGKSYNDPKIKIFHSIYNGELLMRKGENAKAIEHLKESIDLLNKNDFPHLKILSFYTLGKIYSEIGEHEKAIVYLLDAQRLNGPLKDIKQGADIKYELAYIYYLQGNQRATSAALETIELYQHIGLEKSVAAVNNLLGNIEASLYNYDSAIQHYKLSLNTYELLKFQRGIASVKFNISLVYVEQGYLQKALEYQIEALKIEESIENELGIIISYNALGRLFLNMGDFKQSEKYLLKGKKNLENTLYLVHKEENSRFLADLYYAIGNYRMASEHFLESRILSDSLYSTRILNKSLQLSSLYELEKKENEIINLNKNREIQLIKIDLQELQLRQQRILILITIVVLVFFLVFSYLLIKSNKKLKTTQDNLIKSEKKASLGILTAGLCHEINNPLNFIQGGVIALRAVNIQRDEKQERLFRIIEEGVHRTTQILDVLSQFENQYNYGLTKCAISSVLEKSIHVLRDELNEGINISISISSPEKDLFTMGNEDQLVHLFVQIIRNAIQSISKKGDIHIKIDDDDFHYIIKIIDSGQGIEPHLISKIEDPFFTTKDPDQGKGLGLYIADYIVTEHQGEIKYESSLNQGTEVTVSLLKTI